MSDRHNVPAARHPIVTVLMVLAGIILLLPGICSLGFIAMDVSQGHGVSGGVLGALWLVCLAVAAGGVLLIYRALRRRPSPPAA